MQPLLALCELLVGCFVPIAQLQKGGGMHNLLTQLVYVGMCGHLGKLPLKGMEVLQHLLRIAQFYPDLIKPSEMRRGLALRVEFFDELCDGVADVGSDMRLHRFGQFGPRSDHFLTGPARRPPVERVQEPQELAESLKKGSKMSRPRFTTLHPEGSYNMSKDIVERLLLDNMADEVFILQTLKDKVDAETREEIRRALDNIAARSRHIGQQLIEVVRSDGRESAGR